MDHRIAGQVTWRPAFDSGKLYYHKVFQTVLSIFKSDLFQSNFREGSLPSKVSVAQKHLPSQSSVLFRTEHEKQELMNPKKTSYRFREVETKISQDAQYISHKQQQSYVLQVVYKETSFFPKSLFVSPFPRTPYPYVTIVLPEFVSRYPLHLRYFLSPAAGPPINSSYLLQ